MNPSWSSTTPSTTTRRPMTLTLDTTRLRSHAAAAADPQGCRPRPPGRRPAGAGDAPVSPLSRPVTVCPSGPGGYQASVGLSRSRVLAVLTVLVALVPAATARADGGVYVALGDSYTAGPLNPNQHGDPIDCGRSDHNYPPL